MALRLPPTRLVLAIQEGLAAAGAVSAVGGSGLLVSLGCADVANDWDVLVDAEPETVRAVLDGLGLRFVEHPPSGIFRTAALLRVDGGDHEIDVMLRFALEGPDGVVVPIPVRPAARWRGLIMADPRDWIVAYRLMGRSEKAQLLEETLRRAAR